MASLYIKKRSPFVWIGYSLGGVQVNRSTGLRWTRKRDGTPGIPAEAKEFQRQLEARIITGDWNSIRPIAAKKLSFQELLDFYIEVKGPKLARSTVKMYQLSVRKAVEYFGTADVSRLTERQMLAFRQHLIAADREVNTAIWLRHLAALFALAKRKKLIPENPITTDVKFRPAQEPVTCYSVHQLGNLLLTADAEGYEGLSDQLLFLVYSGFRSNESCTVKWGQVDLLERRIRYWNEKGKRWEDQMMDRQFLGFVANLTHKHEPFIFRYRNKSSLNHAVRRINKILGHDESLNVHTLKSCAIGRWKAMRLDVLTISKLAHHRSIETTRRHYDYFDTGRVLGQMDGGLDAGNVPLGPVDSEKFTTLLLHSPLNTTPPQESTTKKPDSDVEPGF
jgi:integrase